METTNFQQKASKLGKETGSLMNYLMSRNKTFPEVGKGATMLSWTDRTAYEVIEVSKDYKRVIIQQYQPERIDNNGMSESQEYKYEKLNPCKEVIVWKWNSWRKECENIVYVDNDKDYTKEEINSFYDAETGLLKLIEGVTKKVKEYQKVRILWGVKDEYYDFTF